MPPLVLVLLLLVQTSQPPAPSPTVGSQAPQEQAKTEARPADVQAQPTVPAAPNTPSVNLPEEKEQPSPDPKCCESGFQFWRDGPNWLIALITAILAGLAYRQWEQMVTAAQAAKESALAAKASAEGLKNTERAYVGIRYRQKGDDWPEDFSFHPCLRQKAPQGLTCYRLHIRVSNTGQTPATIHGGGIQYVVDLDAAGFTPPVVTPDGRGEISPNFLHAGGSYSEKLTYELTSTDIFSFLLKERTWLVGYLDYSDVFERRHRAGFCRRVGSGDDPSKNNLFVDSTCKAYNYDREIKE